jgi:hypothetical protein
MGQRMQYLADPADLLPTMDRKNIRTMVSLMGGSGAGLKETVEKF